MRKNFKKTYSARKLCPKPGAEEEAAKATITEKLISGLTHYLVENNITTRGVALQEMEEMLQEIFEG